MGLAENERFVDTIKTFWEQTLIRELIDAKIKEWTNRLFVKDDEIRKHYQRMQYMPTIKFIKVQDASNAQDAKQRMLKGEGIKGEEILVPLSYEDVRFDVLYNAFDMSAGEAGVFEYANNFIVIYLIKKDNVPVPPLKDIYDRIKSMPLSRKSRRHWRNGLRI